MGQRGRMVLPLTRASCWMRLISSTATIQRRGHRLVHQRRLMALDVVRRPAIAAQELIQFFRFDARENGRVGDLVAVEMQDRQHRAIGDGIEKLVGLPRRRQRTCFRLAIADARRPR